MRKESQLHIDVVTRKIVLAFDDVMKGTYTYKKNGIMYISYPDTEGAEKDIKKILAELVKNIIKIEHESKDR